MDFLKGIFTDNGAPSFSRVGSGVALAFVCGWVSLIVWRTTVLPSFDGVALFIGTLYGLNALRNLRGQ